MGIYARRIFPRLTDRAMRNRNVAAHRRALIPLARGRVLEVGIGSGLNPPFYAASAERIIGRDPSMERLHRAGGQVAQSPRPVRLVAGEELPGAAGGAIAGSLGELPSKAPRTGLELRRGSSSRNLLGSMTTLKGDRRT